MRIATLLLWGLLLLLCSVNAQVKSKPVTIKESEKRFVETIRRIFKDFLQNKDGNDSPENKEAMKTSLISLPYIVHKAELPLLVNVWMYYDPTDFNVRDLIKPVFIRNRKISLVAIQGRIRQKKKFRVQRHCPVFRSGSA